MGYLGGRATCLVCVLWKFGQMFHSHMVIILVSVMPGGWGVGWQVSSLLIIMVMFSWTGMTYYIRASVYKEKSRDYIAAARVIGASPVRIIFKHLLPNVVSTLVTFALYHSCRYFFDYGPRFPWLWITASNPELRRAFEAGGK